MRKPNRSDVPLSLSRLERRFAVWRAKRLPGQPLVLSTKRKKALVAARMELKHLKGVSACRSAFT